jgi:hypothetical protein
MIPKAVLPDFQDFLLSQKLAPEKNVPYLANWVSKFLAFSNRKGQADIGQTVAEFLNSLEARRISRTGRSARRGRPCASISTTSKTAKS